MGYCIEAVPLEGLPSRVVRAMLVVKGVVVYIGIVCADT